MRKSVRREFGPHKPQAIVLDDSAHARAVTARRLSRKGFSVVKCRNAVEFRDTWTPGTADVIISDWELSHNPDDHGDSVLTWVRQRDWDVPFVLISGKLDEAEDRAQVLQGLIDGGGAGFVARGENAIQKACDMAEDLIERRDLALLKMVLALRAGAQADESIATSSGPVHARELLEELVSTPPDSRNAIRPIADAYARPFQQANGG